MNIHSSISVFDRSESSPSNRRRSRLLRTQTPQLEIIEIQGGTAQIALPLATLLLLLKETQLDIEVIGPGESVL